MSTWYSSEQTRQLAELVLIEPLRLVIFSVSHHEAWREWGMGTFRCRVVARLYHDLVQRSCYGSSGQTIWYRQAEVTLTSSESMLWLRIHSLWIDDSARENQVGRRLVWCLSAFPKQAIQNLWWILATLVLSAAFCWAAFQSFAWIDKETVHRARLWPSSCLWIWNSDIGPIDSAAHWLLGRSHPWISGLTSNSQVGFSWGADFH